MKHLSIILTLFLSHLRAQNINEQFEDVENLMDIDQNKKL